MSAVLELRDAALSYGRHHLWRGLDLALGAGELVAVLGPNGSGKTSLLRVVLGLEPLTGGSALVAGRPVRRGAPDVGYVPQQRAFDATSPLRARDLVGLGIDGHRWGTGLPSRRRRARVDELLASVGASAYADVPVGLLSGGEQQRLRIAQALADDPRLLLCDEPLLSLDIPAQRAMGALIDSRRREAGTGVLFVTHEINPVLDMVDRVLYLIDGAFRLGTPDEVMTSRTLSELYRSPVEVVRSGGRLVVLGAHERSVAYDDHHHLAPPALRRTS
ncbi:zinc/manganese transport system ATP-binding protein [Motilibacter rhizosphaerae]|uniref:Zinc/manganese transport system ATP-binding protein n=1 Tax=Motilibacter rhizosphaerae TaxID=598652 RepID=A0A4Q7NTB2_9ACTN|nr:ABC transporter ATP-binding protein [Motilibacter rhizosphaerae]RZS89622.1 zinc/manganese transport system ATP-binding protein [Motilibacter rhizosphaerae]